MKTYKYIALLSFCTSMHLTAAILQWTRLGSGDWNTPTNWDVGRLPGSTGSTDTAILSANDSAFIGLPISEASGTVNLEMRTGAYLGISANAGCFRDMKLGTTGTQGVQLAHSSGSVSATTFLNIGQFSSSECIYELSGNSSLSLGGRINIYSQGVFCFYGSEASVSANGLTIDAGSLEFTPDTSGIGTINLADSFIIQPSSKLEVNLTNYPNTGGTIELVKFTSRTGQFDPANIRIYPSNFGVSGHISYDADSMNLELKPKHDRYAKFWFLPNASAGRLGGANGDIMVNTGSGLVKLNSSALTCSRSTVDGDDFLYSIAWKGSDFDGDGTEDTLSCKLRVSGQSGSQFTYSETPGASSVAIGSTSVQVTDDNGNWAVGDKNINPGETLRFQVSNLALSLTSNTSSGHTATCNGWSSMRVIETNAGNEHKYIIGSGNQLNSGVFNQDELEVSLPQDLPLHITGAGSNVPDREWAIKRIAFEISVAVPNTSELAGVSVSDYTDHPTGPGYLPVYPAETRIQAETYPSFFWSKAPRWLAVRKARAFDTAEVQSIANNFQVVMLEKSNNQGLSSVETGIASAASRLKTENPAIKTLFYWNSSINYLGYDANPVFEANKDSWAKHVLDAQGNKTPEFDLKENIYYQYDHTTAGMRQWWIDTAVGMAELPQIDGVFIDRVFETEGPFFDQAGIPATNYIKMLNTLSTSLPAGKLYIGNTLRNERVNGNREHMRYMHGSYFERWNLPDLDSTPSQTKMDTLATSIQLMREALSKGKIIMLQTGPLADEETYSGDRAAFEELAAYPFALFLIVAEKNAYFSYQGSVNALDDDWLWDTSGIELLNRPIGRPQGPPVKVGNVYTRSFKYVDVTVNLETRVANFVWRTPAAEWNFSENSGTVAMDESPNGNHGTLVGQTPGNGAVSFDGTDSHMLIPAETFSGINRQITVSMWVYGNPDQPGQDSVLYATNSANQRVLNIHLPWDNGRVYWDAGYSSGIDRLITPVMDSNKYKEAWNHWVFTKNANQGVMKIYCNGALVASSATAHTRSITGIAEARIGGSSGASDYSGKVDSVTIYERALTDDEVLDLYEMGRE
jgi:Hypothetical glycosyl hydrolase family 15/Concanavalin A-like lectin/glucanases superfamily